MNLSPRHVATGLVAALLPVSSALAQYPQQYPQQNPPVTQSAPAVPPGTYETPMLEAATASSGGRARSSSSVRQTGGDYSTSVVTTTSSAVEKLSVGGRVHFFHPPPIYTIVCYFVKKGAGTTDYSVAETQRRDVAGPDTPFQFTSKPLASQTTEVSGQAQNAGVKHAGATLTGWVVRVVAGGLDLRTMTSEPELDTLIRSQPAMFPLPAPLAASAIPRATPTPLPIGADTPTPPVRQHYAQKVASPTPDALAGNIGAPPEITVDMARGTRGSGAGVFSTTISGKIHFNNPPMGGYRIVCSFISTMGPTGTHIVGFLQSQTANSADTNFKFTILPPEFDHSDPAAERAAAEWSSYRDWVIRIMDGKSVVGMKASFPALLDYYSQHPDELNNITPPPAPTGAHDPSMPTVPNRE
jgi:hypothetical protein